MSVIFNKVILASDHAGASLKSYVSNYFNENKKTFFLDSVIDGGVFRNDIKFDFPIYAKFVTDCVQNTSDFGVLVCGSGIGMSIAANRFKHIRAALISDVRTAFFARKHNNANVLVLSSEFFNKTDALNEIIKTFISTSFEGKNYAKRLKMIS